MVLKENLRCTDLFILLSAVVDKLTSMSRLGYAL